MTRWSAALVAMIALLLSVATAYAAETTATARLRNAQGTEVGTVTFTEGDGGVRITASVEGLPAGRHGIHIHMTGKCEGPDFKSAGKHFNPTGKQHGLENPDGPHAGDLPNLEVGPDGTATYSAATDRVSLGSGETSLLDADSSALVVHADADDQRTDPTGESGDRIACGAIVSAGMPNAGGGGMADNGFPTQATTALGALAIASVLVARRLATR